MRDFFIAYNFMPIAKLYYLPKSKNRHLGYFKNLRSLCRTVSPDFNCHARRRAADNEIQLGFSK